MASWHDTQVPACQPVRLVLETGHARQARRAGLPRIPERDRDESRGNDHVQVRRRLEGSVAGVQRRCGRFSLLGNGTGRRRHDDATLDQDSRRERFRTNGLSVLCRKLPVLRITKRRQCDRGRNVTACTSAKCLKKRFEQGQASGKPTAARSRPAADSGNCPGPSARNFRDAAPLQGAGKSPVFPDIGDAHWHAIHLRHRWSQPTSRGDRTVGAGQSAARHQWRRK